MICNRPKIKKTRGLGHIILTFLTFLSLIYLSPAPAIAQARLQFSALPGYEIDDQKIIEFGRLPDKNVFYCAPSRLCGPSDPGFNAEGDLFAEGKVTAIRYFTKTGTGTLAVARNYENAVKAVGGRKLTWHEGHEGRDVFFVEEGGRRTWIVLENVYARSYKLTYVEAQIMRQVVTATQLADSISKQGFATLYVNFDNNSAVIKPDSKPAIDEIGELLAKDKTLNLSIEGHTDNVGKALANKTLSEARAASVVKMLVQDKVEARRLQSKGFGGEMPVADNRSEDGRAKNRRVELVKQK